MDLNNEYNKIIEDNNIFQKAIQNLNSDIMKLIDREVYLNNMLESSQKYIYTITKNMIANFI